jgi:hypothetical protein
MSMLKYEQTGLQGVRSPEYTINRTQPPVLSHGRYGVTPA